MQGAIKLREEMQKEEEDRKKKKEEDRKKKEEDRKKKEEEEKKIEEKKHKRKSKGFFLPEEAAAIMKMPEGPEKQALINKLVGEEEKQKGVLSKFIESSGSQRRNLDHGSLKRRPRREEGSIRRPTRGHRPKDKGEGVITQDSRSSEENPGPAGTPVVPPANSPGAGAPIVPPQVTPPSLGNQQPLAQRSSPLGRGINMKEVLAGRGSLKKTPGQGGAAPSGGGRGGPQGRGAPPGRGGL